MSIQCRLVVTVLIGFGCLVKSGECANKVLQLIGEADSYFEVPDDDSLDIDLETEFTVEAWVNTEFDDGENMVVNKEDSYEFAVVNGMFDAAVKPAGQGWIWYNSFEEVPLGEWTHLAITWDGDLLNMFLNGEFVAEHELFGDGTNDSPDTLKIGRRTRGDDTNSSFEGLIDEVRISKVVRYTEDGFEVPKTAFTPDENTVALYHFDSADANGVIKDESGLGNHGELLGDAILIEDNFLDSGEPGDFDGSGALDVGDINALLCAVATGENASAFDLNSDGKADRGDIGVWVKDLKKTWIGDANLDGEFISGDLVGVFQAGKFETDQDAGWNEGDWTGDKRFGSADFVAAFQDGGFEMGPPPASVPEPSGTALSILCFMMLIGKIHRCKRSS